MSQPDNQQLEMQEGFESHETPKQPEAVAHYGPEGDPIETKTSQQEQGGGTGTPDQGGGGS